MSTLLLLAVLSQAPVVVTPAPTAQVLAPRTFSDGHRTYKLYESSTLVAEPKPTDALAAQLKALDATATVVVERPTMRVWKVRDAAALRAALPTLRPAFHDVPNAGRFRVPLGLVCKGVTTETGWLEALEKSGAECLPNFWYPPTLR
ncbi:MAG: hypothetical protein U0228_38925 [Myxococcaceae bacterium]